MLLISYVGLASDSTRVYRAPRGKLYFIKEIFVSVTVFGNSNLFIVDEEKEEQVFSDHGSPLITADLNTAIPFYNFNNIDHKTKYISLVLSASSSADFWVGIYGELISASTSELIWEWFKKGR